MFDFSAFPLQAQDWQAFGGLLFCLLMAKVTRQESRTLLALIAALLVVPSPATFYVVALLSLVTKQLDLIKVSI